MNTTEEIHTKGLVEFAFEFKQPDFLNDRPERRDDADWHEVTLEYRSVCSKLKELEKRKESLRDAIITMSGHQNAIGNGIELKSYFKKGSIDYDLVPELENVDLEKYRGKMKMYWKITEV